MQHPAEHSPLGKSSEYVSTYAPELLSPISRTTKWAELGLTADDIAHLVQTTRAAIAESL